MVGRISFFDGMVRLDGVDWVDVLERVDRLDWFDRLDGFDWFFVGSVQWIELVEWVLVIG